MAERTWISLSGNAASTASWSGGSLPVSGDRVIFSSFGVPPLSGLDFSGQKFLDVYVTPQCRFNIGSETNPLKCEATLVRHYGNCQLNYQSSNAGAELDTENIIVDSGYRGVALILSCGAFPTLVYDLHVIQGEAIILPSCVPMRNYIGTRNAITKTREAKVTYVYQANLVPDSITQYSGTIISHINTTASHFYKLYGGTFFQETGFMERCFIDGGTLIYNAVGTSTHMFLKTGTLDFSRTTNSRTITNLFQIGGNLIRTPETTITNFYDLRVN